MVQSQVCRPPLPAPQLRRTALELPEVTEAEAVRYFTHLSQLTFSVDTHFSPSAAAR